MGPKAANWQTLRWEGGVEGALVLLDQSLLPTRVEQCRCEQVVAVWEAIRSLKVRGAPAIGIAAAYGVVIGLREVPLDDADQALRSVDQVVDYLGSSRPTAVNLFWALERMARRAKSLLQQQIGTEQLLRCLLQEAQLLHDEDRAICRSIGRSGAPLLNDGMGILTHCNAGGLAASEYGTALAVIYAAQDEGKRLHVYADETRPLLQGARLTAWELMQRGIDTTLICDNMAAQVMREGRIDAVITGADRIAANGDVANKIGTYGVALLARAHNIPFYVAAPRSTFDLTISGGAEIPIEQRPAEEITAGMGKPTAPADVPVYNPAFDVTPAELITALITDQGIITPVTAAAIAERLSGVGS